MLYVRMYVCIYVYRNINIYTSINYILTHTHTHTHTQVRTHSLPCSGSLVLAPATTLLQRSVPRGATAALESTDESIDLVIKGDGVSPALTF